jgi:hypothetical protein
MAELGAAERELVANYWWQRALGELTSWHGFQHVLADLKVEHAAPAVLELAERALLLTVLLEPALLALRRMAQQNESARRHADTTDN